MGCGASHERPSEDAVVPPSRPCGAISESVSRQSMRSGSPESECRSSGDGRCSADTSDRNLELESILHEMPELKAKLCSVQKFDPDALLDATSKPFSVLGYHMISGLAEKLGIDRTHLPQFVGTLGHIMKKQGRAAQVARLLSLQFIEAQVSGTGPDGGLLAQWATENPSCALALVISAMVSNGTGIAKAVAGKPSRRKSSLDSRRRRSFHLNEALVEFLSYTMFFREMEPDVRVKLLTRVKETLAATDPEMPKLMLDHEKEMELADRDVLIMQATLLVAMYSHVFRKFKVHFEWCRSRVEALTGAPMSSAPSRKASFALVEDDLKMKHYAQAHSWLLGKVLAPFLQMWVRLTGNDSSINVLCIAVQRLAGTYDMFCEDTNVPHSSRSVPVVDLSTPQEEAETSWQLYLDNSERSQSVPADPAAVLSVCEMYGISSMQVLFASSKSSCSKSRADAIGDSFANVQCIAE